MEFFQQYNYIRRICTNLRSKTGNTFQSSVYSILYEYYNWEKLTFEMPSPGGGDFKNDGWVKETGVFYQIYSPSTKTPDSSKSFKRDLKNKFSEDLMGLVKNIITLKKWGGKINEFIFIVNTFDQNLPEDSEGYYEKEARSIMDEFNISFEYSVQNVDYFENILYQVDDESVFKKMAINLNDDFISSLNHIDEEAVLETVQLISSNIIDKTFSNDRKSNDFDVIEIKNKIDLNKLNEIEEQINQAVLHFDVLENTINELNKMNSDLFTIVKDYIIKLYINLSEEYEGVELFHKIRDSLLKNYRKSNYYTNITFLLEVYVFEKCDIFEKVDIK